MANSKFFTKALAAGESFAIVENDGIAQASIIILSGTCQVQGNYRLGTEDSTPFTLTAGMPVTLSSRGPNAPIDGVTITAGNPGTVAIVCQP